LRFCWSALEGQNGRNGAGVMGGQEDG